MFLEGVSTVRFHRFAIVMFVFSSVLLLSFAYSKLVLLESRAKNVAEIEEISENIEDDTASTEVEMIYPYSSESFDIPQLTDSTAITEEIKMDVPSETAEEERRRALS